MEKYINFPQYPLFAPMLNPADLLLSGVFGGTFLNDPNPEEAEGFKEHYSRIPWGKISKIGNRQADPAANATMSLADHKHSLDHDDFNARGFFLWYISFFYAKPEERSDLKNIICIQAPYWIYQWARHIADTFNPSVKKDQLTGKPILSQEQTQRAIELAWNPDYFPHTKLDQFKQYEPISNNTSGSNQL